MKILLALLLVISPLTDLDKIARINKAKKEAERAYLAEDYILANAKYLYLRDSLGVNDDNLRLNLANTEFILNDTASALNSYAELKDSPNKEIRSRAYQQLGAMQFNTKKYKEALELYKSALKSDPGNADARYNYELLKKLIKEQEEQNKDKQNKDEKNKDQKDQDKKDQQEQNKEDQQKQDQEQQDKDKQDQEKKDQEQQDQEKKDQEDKDKKEQQGKKPDEQKKEDEQKKKPNPIDEDKLKEMKISEEKAKLILEAMKNNEVQYIQQNKRKAKKKKDPAKPDW
jgi:tetratricopeptide (TPR) repeat protein